MAGTHKAASRRKKQRHQLLLLCFVVGLVAGSAMLIPHWNGGEILSTLTGILLSAALLYAALNALLLRGLRTDLAYRGCDAVPAASLPYLSRADHVVIDEPMVLRREGRRLAAWQPHLDPRLRPLLLALARNSDHGLAVTLAQSLEQAGVLAEPIMHVERQPSGQVNAQWRGHRISLFVAPLSYGDLKLSMHLRMDGQAAATVVFDEDVRADAPGMIRGLKPLGITPMLYAEDRAEMLGPLARQLRVTAQACCDADEKQQAMARHLAAGHAPLILSKADGQGRWALHRLGMDAQRAERPLLGGDVLAAIPATIASVREFYAARRHMIRAVSISHLVAFALIISGLPSLWVGVAAWAVCGLSMRHPAMRAGKGAGQKREDCAKGAAI